MNLKSKISQVWSFDKYKGDFQNHIEKSIPFYKTGHEIIIQASNYYLKNGSSCCDIGCSTGGFTDVLIKMGAKKVYAIDVGYGQLDWRLRNSEKVILFERTNARELDTNIIPELLDLVVCDVSFISLKKVLLPVKKLLNSKYEILSLVKPQFEAKKNEVGRGGIIKDSRIHNRIFEELMFWFKQNFDYEYLNIIDSPITGQKGNKEFFIYIKN